MAKFYIDDHNNISEDHYMDLLNMDLKESDIMGDSTTKRTMYNNDVYPPINRGEILLKMCTSDMLTKLQNGINNGEKCVLKIFFGDEITCREDHNCDKCICEELCKKT